MLRLTHMRMLSGLEPARGRQAEGGEGGQSDPEFFRGHAHTLKDQLKTKPHFLLFCTAKNPKGECSSIQDSF